MRFLRWAAIFVVGSALLVAAPVPNLSRPVPLNWEQSGATYQAHLNGASLTLARRTLSIQTNAAQPPIQFRFTNSHPGNYLEAQSVSGTLNRFIGNDPSAWQLGIPLYASVRARSLYSGVDAIFYGQNGQFEYDLVVAPFANPKAIQIAISGATTLSLTSEGNLELSSGNAKIIQHRPTAYQVINGQRVAVESRFELARNRHLRFVLGAYDRSRPLTIDPVISYSSYIGGTGLDEGHALAVDATGNVYIAGRTFSTPNSNGQVLLLKLTPAGKTTQSIFGGKSGDSSANAVAVDAAGNVLLSGSTASPDFPVVAGTGGYVLQPGLLGSMNAFLLSLTANNTTLNFSTYFGGSYADEALGMVIGGPNNYLYVVGDTTSPNLQIISASAFQLAQHGGYDGFLVCLTTTGTLVWGTYLGGTGDDHAAAVAVDASGNTYVVGATSSSDFPVNPGGFTDSFQNANHGSTDGFAIKFFPDGTLAYWGTYMGGASTDLATGVGVDTSGNVYVAGTTASEDFPALDGKYQRIYAGGNSDGFVLTLENNGQGLWGTLLGSPGDDVINGLALDGSANIILTGSTNNANFPLTSDAVQAKIGGGADAIIARLSTDGSTLLFSTYLGGSGNEIGSAVLGDSSGRIFITGSTGSSANDFPTTSGTLQPKYGGGTTDAFISILGCPVALPVVTAAGVVNAGSYLPSAISPGAAISIFGTNLGCTPAAATALPLATKLSNVSVQINGTAIPLYYVSETQINAQVPYETPVGSAALTVTGPGGTSASISIPITSAAPGLFTANGQAATLNQDFTVNSSSNPAKVGSVVTVFFTGPGPLSGTLVTGAAVPPAPPYFTAALPTSATIGALDAPLYFVGMSPGLVGLAQANITVPTLASGTYPVILTIGGVASQSANLSITQ